MKAAFKTREKRKGRLEKMKTLVVKKILPHPRFKEAVVTLMQKYRHCKF